VRKLSGSIFSQKNNRTDFEKKADLIFIFSEIKVLTSISVEIVAEVGLK